MSNVKKDLNKVSHQEFGINYSQLDEKGRARCFHLLLSYYCLVKTFKKSV
jgi:hypothetical protein